MPLLALMIFSFATGRSLGQAPPWFWLYALVGFFVTLNWEVSARSVLLRTRARGSTATRGSSAPTAPPGGARGARRRHGDGRARRLAPGPDGVGFQVALIALYAVCLLGFLQFRLPAPVRRTARRMEHYAGFSTSSPSTWSSWSGSPSATASAWRSGEVELKRRPGNTNPWVLGPERGGGEGGAAGPTGCGPRPTGLARLGRVALECGCRRGSSSPRRAFQRVLAGAGLDDAHRSPSGARGRRRDGADPGGARGGLEGGGGGDPELDPAARPPRGGSITPLGRRTPFAFPDNRRWRCAPRRATRTGAGSLRRSPRQLPLRPGRRRSGGIRAGLGLGVRRPGARLPAAAGPFTARGSHGGRGPGDGGAEVSGVLFTADPTTATSTRRS